MRGAVHGGDDHSRSAFDKSGNRRISAGQGPGPAVCDNDVSAFVIASTTQTFLEGTDIGGLRLAAAAENSHHWHSLLPRARCKRPRRRATKARNELPAPHSITSSARTSREAGKVMPSVLAVLRLMTNSNLVDCITGRSAGFSPLRIRPV